MNSQNETEHSDRARYVTEQVALWISNDNDHVGVAKKIAENQPDRLGSVLADLIRTAKPYSAPWQVAQELAPNDYDRIHWKDVAAELIDMDI